MAEVVAYPELSHCARGTGKSVWDASDRDNSSDNPRRQPEIPNATLRTAELAVKGRSNGHPTGVRGI
jgi:hypothetical protein